MQYCKKPMRMGLDPYRVYATANTTLPEIHDKNPCSIKSVSNSAESRRNFMKFARDPLAAYTCHKWIGRDCNRTAVPVHSRRLSKMRFSNVSRAFPTSILHVSSYLLTFCEGSMAFSQDAQHILLCPRKTEPQIVRHKDVQCAQCN